MNRLIFIVGLIGFFPLQFHNFLFLSHFSCVLKDKCKTTNITLRTEQIDFEVEVSEEARNSNCPRKDMVCCHFENAGE